MIRKKVGERIKQIRQNQKQSQEEIALDADMNRSYLAEVEAGKRNVSIINLEKICNSLNVSLKDFFDSEIF